MRILRFSGIKLPPQAHTNSKYQNKASKTTWFYSVILAFLMDSYMVIINK